MGDVPGREIRLATLDDTDGIASVQVRAWQAAYRGVMPDDYLDGLSVDERSAMWRRILINRRDLQTTRVLTVDGVVAGFSSNGPENADPPNEGVGELYAINIDPDHWRSGHGRALIREVQAELGATFREAVLWVVPQNARARALYEAEGWAFDGTEREDDVLGTRVDEVRYRRSF